jgi:hypothetical protein
VWLAAGIWLLLQRGTVPAVKALTWSGVLYAFSFLFVGVATDYRYHFWTTLSIGLGLGIHFAGQEDWIASLKRLLWAVLPIAAAGYVARLAFTVAGW